MGTGRWTLRGSPTTVNEGSNPQGDTEVGAPEMVPVFQDFPRWLGGMTQEAGLALTMLAVA